MNDAQITLIGDALSMLDTVEWMVSDGTDKRVIMDTIVTAKSKLDKALLLNVG